MIQPFEKRLRQEGGSYSLDVGIDQFFMKIGPVHQTLRKIARKLEELGIPYAIVGGMALNAHGYERTTVDVDILVTPESLKLIHEKLDGLGYLPPFEHSKHLRDTETGVKIEFLTTGGFPGDGKPKPVAFPDPEKCAVEIGGEKYISLPTLLELKLASGMSNVTRAKDIGDVVALIKELNLMREFEDQLNPYVREKYRELWDAIDQDTSDVH